MQIRNFLLSKQIFLYRQNYTFFPPSRVKLMNPHQMRPELIELMKKTVERFNISSQTYYHAVLLFNVIQLKKDQDQHSEYFTIPVKKRDFCWSSDSDSEYEEEEDTYEPVTEYITVHHTQMPERDKLEMTVCLFLVHKLYESYPLCLQYLIRHVGIDERFEEYIISLEKEFLVKLAYKLQNMLPSNQTLFACQLWDEFTQNISSTCVDIKFGIKQLFENSKKQIRTAHQINRPKIQPEFKNFQNQQSFEALSRNIQILVHNKNIYDHYLRKSLSESDEDLPTIKRIGLAITYVTIAQQTNMVFGKKYKFNEKENLPINTKANFIEFVFDDFLEAHFGIKFHHLKHEIQVVQSILQNKHEKKTERPTEGANKFCSIKDIPDGQQNIYSNFLLRINEKPTLQQHHHKYHRKCKKKMSISSTKTDKQVQNFLFNNKKRKWHSILDLENKFSLGKDKALEPSTKYQSNISQNAQSIAGSICSNEKRQQPIQKRFFDMKHNSSDGFEFLGGKNSINLAQSPNSIKYPKLLIHSTDSLPNHQEGQYKTSQFVAADS